MIFCDKNFAKTCPSRLRWHSILSTTPDHFNVNSLLFLQIGGLDHLVTKQAVKSARNVKNSPKEILRITYNGYQNPDSEPTCDSRTPSKKQKTETKKLTHLQIRTFLSPTRVQSLSTAFSIEF